MRPGSPGSGGDKLADTAIAQEDEGKQILDKIDKLEADDPEFDKLVDTFIKDGREHIEFEETQVWPALKAALSKEESEQLGAKVADGKKTAPTRPHPHTPAAPGVLKTAGSGCGRRGPGQGQGKRPRTIATSLVINREEAGPRCAGAGRPPLRAGRRPAAPP